MYFYDTTGFSDSLGRSDIAHCGVDDVVEVIGLDRNSNKVTITVYRHIAYYLLSGDSSGLQIVKSA